MASLCGALSSGVRPPGRICLLFWRIEALKAELAAGPQSDRQVLPYLILSSVLLAAVGLVPLTDINKWDVVGGCWSALLAVMGTLYVYRQNGAEHGQQLLARYLAIGWVVGIRCLAVVLLLTVVIIGVWELLSEVPETTTWQACLLIAVVETAFYWRVGHHIAEVASTPLGPNKALGRGRDR